MYSWAESSNPLPPDQSGFRKRGQLTTIFQLTKIVAQQLARNQTQHVGIIFLDVMKAFDSVARRSALSTVESGSASTSYFVDFKDRVVQVFIKGTTSRDVTINHGVRQGSPLSPILYLVYTMIYLLPPRSSAQSLRMT